MLDSVYEWIRSLAYYTILMTAIMQIIPNNGYKKYIQFYMGLVIVLMLCTPLIKILGMEDEFLTLYQEQEYKLELKELEKKSEYLREVELDEYISIEDTN